MLRKLLAICAMAVICASPAVADHHQGGQKMEHGEMEMGPMGPPEELKELAYMVGEWDVTMKVRMGPEAPWTESTATASVKPILGGGAYQMHFLGSFEGMEMEGYHLLTYDREQKRYESTWIDNMACRESTAAGNFKDGKLVCTGTDLHMGQEMQMRQVTKKISNDEYKWVMEASWDGENWYKSMELTYARKAGAR